MNIDGYMNYQNLLVPNCKGSTKFPKAGLDKIKCMMLGESFLKEVLWKILIPINSEGEFKVSQARRLRNSPI